MQCSYDRLLRIFRDKLQLKMEYVFDNANGTRSLIIYYGLLALYAESLGKVLGKCTCYISCTKVLGYLDHFRAGSCKVCRDSWHCNMATLV